MSGGRRPDDPRADRLRDRFAEVFGDAGPPVPVEAIAEDLLGLCVGEAELTVSGLLVPARREVWLSAAEARQSPARRRFTLAHELGHWVCQVREGRGEALHCRPEVGGTPVADPLEREANVFAAALLMPEAAVRAAVAAGARGEELEALFGVSPPAMAWRLYNLGLGEAPSVAADDPSSDAAAAASAAGSPGEASTPGRRNT